MYIRSVHIENVRSIETFEMTFEHKQFAGWHVILGENGTGKSTIVRAISLGLIGPTHAIALREDWKDWLRIGTARGKVQLVYDFDPKFEGKKGRGKPVRNYYLNAILYIEKKKDELGDFFRVRAHSTSKAPSYLWSDRRGWFSAAFGPYRRLRGGDKDKERIFASNPKVGAHITAFGEDVALTEVELWCNELFNRSRDNDPEAKEIINGVKDFINEGKLLPHSASIVDIKNDGIFFKDGEGNKIAFNELSDGYRSILALTFELIRLLIASYGTSAVFQGKRTINLPGVVIIDEIDAHLHPTWQTKIGQWFTKYFPKLQFIVTTHSPLICRACGKNGKIFKLSAPGSEKKSAEITGIDRDRLVYGDILEAYETDAFGDGVEWSEEGRNLQKEYRDLVYKKRYGVEMTEPETKRFNHLKQIFKSNVEAS